jgi:hypothetical protein
MRELIDGLKKLNEQLDDDATEVADLVKKHGFGSVAWQDAMVDRIQNKIKNKEPLTGLDLAFMETQFLHHRQVADQLKSMGVPGGRLNVN